MAAIPFMPLYVADYLADAAHLSTIQHGAYLLLIMNYWQRGQALPNEDAKLARIVGMSVRNWQQIKPPIVEMFDTGTDSGPPVLFHQRIEQELDRVRVKSLKNRKGGLARAKQLHSERSANAQRTLSHTDTDTDRVPLSNDNGASADPDKVLWLHGKDYLAPYVGGREKAGSLIGKWIKGRKQIEVAQAITAAQVERAVDPVAYITAALRKPKADEWENPLV